MKLIPPQLSDEVQECLGWADRARTLGVRANADTPEDARKAREFGAEGIGLVRTEHMFFAADRIPIVREMIMASETITRRGAVQKLLPFQRDDFIGIFRAMDGLPVTIRLLDPPLHEFLANPKEYREMLEERCRLEARSEEHTSELQSPYDLVCRLLLEKKKKKPNKSAPNFLPFCINYLLCTAITR